MLKRCLYFFKAYNYTNNGRHLEHIRVYSELCYTHAYSHWIYEYGFESFALGFESGFESIANLRDSDSDSNNLLSDSAHLCFQ